MIQRTAELKKGPNKKFLTQDQLVGSGQKIVQNKKKIMKPKII